MVFPSRFLALFSLLLLLAIRPALDTAWSRAPAPASKNPQVYSLIYVSKRADEDKSRKPRKDQLVEEWDQAPLRDWQVTAIKSGSATNEAINKNPRLRILPVMRGSKSPYEWLAQHIRVSVLEDTGLIRVWVDGGSPREQAVLVNAVTKAYFDRIEARRVRAKKHIEDCELHKSIAQGYLDEARKANKGQQGGCEKQVKRWTMHLESAKAELEKLTPRIHLLEIPEVSEAD